MSSQFPKGFIWGVATSSLQIEGATREGGRGESIWDRFAATPGNIVDGSNADVACDHYHRWRQDIDLIKRLGVSAYRFSTAWPRILPDGRGTVNSRGLDFYDALVDELLAQGIRPFLTLNHWDLPQALGDEGGWVSRATAEAFTEYAGVVADRLGDRVKDWMTHNEPWCIASLGYERGDHAPGRTEPAESLLAAHNLMVSHGWAVDEIRKRSADCEVGIVLNLTPASPASPSREDQDAARWFDGFFNRWFLDPILRGHYPADAVADRASQRHLDRAMSFVQPGDLATISTPIDFLGVNYYSRASMKRGEDGTPEEVIAVPEEELTDMGWEVYPQGLHEMLVRLQRDYKVPKMYITENGAAYSNGPDPTDRIDDEKRVRYFHGHLEAAHRAITEGVPLCGYFAWSLMDNFEWAHGFEKRFGLYWVDFATQQRIPKDSAIWYRETVAKNAIVDVATPSNIRSHA